MSYHPVATIDGIEFHPQASNVGIVTEYSKFVETTNGNPELSGTIWRRTPRRQEYVDIFNNVSGMRNLLEDLNDNLIYATTTNTSHGDIEFSYASRQHGGKSIDIDRTPLSDFFDRAHFLKRDIEFAIEQLNMRGHGEVVVHVFNEYAYSKRKSSTTHCFHIDGTPTYYIQIGGAGLEFTNAIPQYRINPVMPVEFGDDDPSTIRIADIAEENRVMPHEIGILKPADFMHFHGWRSGRSLVHRAPHDRAVKQQGRLAVSIYPS